MPEQANEGEKMSDGFIDIKTMKNGLENAKWFQQ